MEIWQRQTWAALRVGMYKRKGAEAHYANQKVPALLIISVSTVWAVSQIGASMSMYPGRGCKNIPGNAISNSSYVWCLQGNCPASQLCGEPQCSQENPPSILGFPGGFLMSLSDADTQWQAFVAVSQVWGSPDLGCVHQDVGWKLGSGLLQGTKFFLWQKQAGQPITTHVYWRKASHSHVCIQATVCATPADIPLTRVNMVGYRAEGRAVHGWNTAKTSHVDNLGFAPSWSWCEGEICTTNALFHSSGDGH